MGPFSTVCLRLLIWKRLKSTTAEHWVVSQHISIPCHSLSKINVTESDYLVHWLPFLLNIHGFNTRGRSIDTRCYGLSQTDNKLRPRSAPSHAEFVNKSLTLCAVWSHRSNIIKNTKGSSKSINGATLDMFNLWRCINCVGYVASNGKDVEGVGRGLF
jgi:hypothetical protein